MFSKNLPNEALLRTRRDDDFGHIELWRWHYESPAFFDWRGRMAGEDGAEVPLSIKADPTDPESAFGFIDGTARETYRRFAMRPASIRVAVAEYEFSHAEDWAYQADLPAPTFEAFSESLQITEIVVKADAKNLHFEVWLRETTTDCFCGHNIRATFDAHGVLQGAGLG